MWRTVGQINLLWQQLFLIRLLIRWSRSKASGRWPARGKKKKKNPKNLSTTLMAHTPFADLMKQIPPVLIYENIRVTQKAHPVTVVSDGLSFILLCNNNIKKCTRNERKPQIETSHSISSLQTRWHRSLPYSFFIPRWGILFSHPRDYTPVCTTELGRAARLSSEFSERNVKMIALSIDRLEDHRGWTEVW